MIDNTISADQVRARAGITFAEAQTATYMASAALSGWTLADLRSKTGMGVSAARGLAFRFGLEFPDYNPFSAGKKLVWRKARPGWELFNGSDAIGRCLLAEDRQLCGKQYEATACRLLERSWSARQAMERIGRALDAMSDELFGGAPVETRLSEKDGTRHEILFPVADDDVARCRAAIPRREAA